MQNDIDEDRSKIAREKNSPYKFKNFFVLLIEICLRSYFINQN